MKKIAIAIFENRISPRLDCTQKFLFVSVNKGEVTKREIIQIVQISPLEKINTLIQLDVDAVICGGVTNSCLNKFANNSIEVIPWMCGDAEEILNEFIKMDENAP